MVIKEGYKQTEIGIIPNDWVIKTISEFTTPVRGGSPRPAGDPKYFNGNFIPWLTVASLTNIPISQIFVSETENYLTEAGSFLSRILDKETLIIANSGATLGVAKLLSIKCCANDGIAALLDFDKNISKFYVVYFINTKIKYLREVVATGNGQPNLNTDLIGKIQIPLPPTLTEQTAIATALSDTDGLITSLEKLIAKKRNIKQGAMQQLLQPKDGWEVKKLGEIALFYKGKGLPKSHINDNGKFKCIHYGELFTKHKEYIREVISYTSETVNLFYSITNDVLMPTSDVTPNGLATASCIKESGVILGGDVLVIRISEKILDGIFLSYFITKNREQVMKLVSGSTVYHLSGSDMKNLTVYFPLIEEQNRIVSILTDMDAELSALEQKLEKYKKVKLGMMQELLTGKTRLV